MQKMPSLTAKDAILCNERCHLLHQKMASFTSSLRMFYVFTLSLLVLRK
ncbi:hypothetical protein BACCELL_01102 [Bacteroides cellulosilyticus DSM 14838]|uniref:Uncharacterized protein n=1 Tax=Bacteroides cellulosilyticus DSM 14838 TaxID=537012 RepID=E2NA04_9BACE|nr:hypothetical protein BACCELL_01102 [Bacteroides cellulosilyticus DSM 14838]